MLSTVGAMAAAIGLSVLCGCREEGPASKRPMVYNIVEWEDASHFRLFRPDGDEAFRLTAAQPLVTEAEIKAGECLMIGYRQREGSEVYSDGEIELEGYNMVNNGKVEVVGAEDIKGWDSEPVYVQSLWRAGRNICMRVRLTYDAKPRRFALVVDSATVNKARPRAYLYHRRGTTGPNFERQYYAAFDMSALWALPTCKGLDIEVNNSNLTGKGTFRVEKFIEQP